MITAKAKAQNTRESHAQKTAQRQVTFEQQQKQREDEHRLELQRRAREIKLEETAKDIQTAAEMRRKRFAGTED